MEFAFHTGTSAAIKDKRFVLRDHLNPANEIQPGAPLKWGPFNVRNHASFQLGTLSPNPWDLTLSGRDCSAPLPCSLCRFCMGRVVVPYSSRGLF
jgi:hypothetical protein